MGTLADAFVESVRRRTDDEWIRELGKVVKLALWPFDNGRITISRYDESFLGRELTFRIDLETFPDYPFIWKIEERQLYEAYYPEQFLFDSMSGPLFKHFRYRPSLPVDDHIVLGED